MNRFISIKFFAVMLALLGALAAPASAQLKSSDDPQGNEVWKKVRASLFQERPITWPADDVLMLDAPARAEDAAIVPVAVKLRFAQSKQHYVDKLWLVIDNNPSPISAIFNFTPESGRAD